MNKINIEILEILDKLNKEPEPKRDSEVAKFIKSLLENERN